MRHMMLLCCRGFNSLRPVTIALLVTGRNELKPLQHNSVVIHSYCVAMPM